MLQSSFCSVKVSKKGFTQLLMEALMLRYQKCRYAWGAISEWVNRMGGAIEATRSQGRHNAENASSGYAANQRRHSITCMAQLQAKQPVPLDESQVTSVRVLVC